jgi:hypothetical protein
VNFTLGVGRTTDVTRNDKASEALEAHFKKWQEMGERMRAIVAPVLKQQEQLQKYLQPIVESQQAFQKALEPILAEQERWKRIVRSIELPKIALPDLAPLTKQAEEFRRSIEGLISPAFEELQRSFRELPPRTQEALILLGTHGWYLDLEMPLPGLWELKKALTDGNVAEAEDALIEYFESRTDEIEKSIVERFPKRQKLLNAAFNAHRRQEYELSIPVLLAQTDGICKEVVNEYLFLKHNKKPRTAIYVEQVASDTYRAALLSPLAQTLPIGASENERDEGFNELNRHMVLHGEALDYGNKKNSLKAISLINYVAHVLKTDDKDP